jgi:hypothetical protein
MLNFPILFSIPMAVLLWLAARFGAVARTRRPMVDGDRDDFGVVQTATLTLLALLIGFTFSMATVRYDLRKNFEEAEANAIGTEYVRVGLLPSAEAGPLQAQLKKYTDLRIEFYKTRDRDELQRVNAETSQLQTEMWNAVQGPAVAQQTPIMALVVAGMNDVLNSQGYTQAAWWNRIPTAAWVLLVLTAVGCNILVGYGSRGGQVKSSLLVVMPVLVAISFLLIADIDSPRGGLIHVSPQNLTALWESLHPGIEAPR